MLADPARPPASHASTTPLVDDPDACLALLRLLADGTPHRPAELARRVLGDADAVPRIDAALAAFVSVGFPLRRLDDGVVRSEPFHVLDAAAIAADLPRWRVEVAGSTGSTNAALSRAVRAEPRATPRLLAAEWQGAGRGRRGRRWTSAPGVSLTVSFAVGIARPISGLDGVTLACGLGVRDALDRVGVVARLKWPNDLLVDGRKLGGILVEAHAAGEYASVVVVGVGLNVGAVAGTPEHGLPATDLAHAGARSLDRNALVVDVAAALERRLARFARDGFAPFVDEWNAADAFHDAAVTLQGIGGAREADRSGIARGVDGGGALLLDDAGVRCRFISGEVSLRPVGAAT